MLLRPFRIASSRHPVVAPDPTVTRLRSRWIHWLEISILTAALLGATSFARAEVTDDYSGFRLAHFTPLIGSPAALAVADLDGDGFPDVVAAERSPDRLTIWWNDGHGDLLATPTLIATAGARALVTLDTDGDGRRDVVWSDGTGMYRVRVTASRTVESPTRLVEGTALGPLVVIDPDRDGHDGVLYGNGADIVIKRGSVSGLGPPVVLATMPWQVFLLTAGEADAHGMTDIVAGNDFSGTPGDATSLSALRIDADCRVVRTDGVLRSERPNVILGLDMADLDGDGSADLLVRGYEKVFVWWSNGQGDFGYPVTEWSPPLSGLEPAVATADLDGDGRRDVVVGAGEPLSNGNRVFALYRGLGGRSFSAPRFYTAEHETEYGAAANALVLADMDRDGRPDLVSLMWWHSGQGYPGKLAIALQSATGEFALPRFDVVRGAYGEHRVSAHVVTDAFGDRDGVLLADSRGTLVLHLDRDGRLVQETGPALVGPLLFADVDGDGREDAVEVRDTTSIVHLARRDGGYAEGETVVVPRLRCAARLENGRGMALVGVDLTGHAVIAERGRKGGYTYEVLPALFGARPEGSNYFAAWNVGVAAFPAGPGHRDQLVFVGMDSSVTGIDVVRMTRSPDGEWRRLQRVTLRFPDSDEYLRPRPGLEPLAVGDVDGDGDPDVATLTTIQSDLGYVQILRGDRDGMLTPVGEPMFANSESPHVFRLADFDNDGHLDVVTGAEMSGFQPRFVVLFTDAEARFSRRATLMPPTQGYFNAAVTPDLDGDGTPDLVGWTASWYLPDGMLTTYFGRGVTTPTNGHHVPRGRPVAGTTATPAIAAVTPMPVRDAFDVTLALAPQVPARLELLDVTGRRIETREVAAGAGTARFTLGGGIRSGVYWLRLTQGARCSTARVVVMR